MKKYFCIAFLGCHASRIIASGVQRDNALKAIHRQSHVHEDMGLKKRQARAIDEPKKQCKKVQDNVQKLQQANCVQRGTRYFKEVFAHSDVVPDDCLFEAILTQMRSEGFEAPFLSWLAYQSLSEVAKKSSAGKKRGRSRADAKQSKTKMMMALPSEEIWQRWCAMYEFDVPGKRFTSAQVMQAAAQLVLAVSAHNAQSKDVYVCSASGRQR